MGREVNAAYNPPHEELVLAVRPSLIPISPPVMPPPSPEGEEEQKEGTAGRYRPRHPPTISRP